MRSRIERLDHRIILGLIEQGATVLDLGCGDGSLLKLLAQGKGVMGQGIELDDQEIFRCVEKGVFALHGDLDSGLEQYKDKSFDYVILNQSIQQVRNVEAVISDALRVGKKVIVGVPNFANYRARLQLFFGGRAPVTKTLPYRWFETPNIRSFSLKDFERFCADRGIAIEKAHYLRGLTRVLLMPNLFAESGIFLIKR